MLTVREKFPGVINELRLPSIPTVDDLLNQNTTAAGSPQICLHQIFNLSSKYPIFDVGIDTLVIGVHPEYDCLWEDDFIHLDRWLEHAAGESNVGLILLPWISRQEPLTPERIAAEGRHVVNLDQYVASVLKFLEWECRARETLGARFCYWPQDPLFGVFIRGQPEEVAFLRRRFGCDESVDLNGRLFEKMVLFGQRLDKCVVEQYKFIVDAKIGKRTVISGHTPSWP